MRPEVVSIFPDGAVPAGHNVIEGTVEEGIYAGALTKLRLRLPSGAPLVLHAAPTTAAVAPGQRVRVGWPVAHSVCFTS